MVPFFNLGEQTALLTPQILKGFNKILTNTNFILGQEVIQFENNFAQYCGVNNCIGVNSGTDALTLALKALDIGPGDEVIIPANTFIATAEAVALAGATPVLVDIEEDNYNIDTSLIEEKITKQTRAIIPVHLFGRLADIETVVRIAKMHNLKVIEDACQAHGAELNGHKAGSFGDIGCFSFYPSKNLGAFGDGGACVTNNAELNAKIKALRDHGSTVKYEHQLVGMNSRLDTVQAMVLDNKLPHLDRWNTKRRDIAYNYKQLLSGIVKTPDVSSSVVFHLYVIRVKNRVKVMKMLKDAGIGIGIHYPKPIYLQPAFKHLGYKKGDFPITEKVSEEIISLPMYPEMRKMQVISVADNLKRILK